MKKEINLQTIGSRLRVERERLNLSQDEFGVACGVTRRTVTAWERGDQFPNAEVLRLVAAVGVDVLYVLTEQRTPMTTNALSAEESALLDNYRHASPGRQASLRDVSAALASATHGKAANGD